MKTNNEKKVRVIDILGKALVHPESCVSSYGEYESLRACVDIHGLQGAIYHLLSLDLHDKVTLRRRNFLEQYTDAHPSSLTQKISTRKSRPSRRLPRIRLIVCFTRHPLLPVHGILRDACL